MYYHKAFLPPLLGTGFPNRREVYFTIPSSAFRAQDFHHRTVDLLKIPICRKQKPNDRRDGTTDGAKDAHYHTLDF
jgi:hypothetical protein